MEETTKMCAELIIDPGSNTVVFVSVHEKAVIANFSYAVPTMDSKGID
jgi:hypothetical protein